MKANRLLATAMAAAMTIGLMTGCGSSAGSSASDSSDGIAAGTYTYRQTLANADEVEIPPYNFGGDNILSNYLNAYSVELTLEDDGTFTLESRGWMTEDLDASGEEPAEYEYGTSLYGQYTTTATGTYESDGDQVTITAEVVTHTIPEMGSSYMAQIFTAGNSVGGSYNEEGEDYYGEWSSEDIEEVLELVPDTVFTIDGDTIVTWNKAGQLTSVETEAANIYFYDDGTVLYQDLVNGLGESMTWTSDGETVTVTDTYGTEYVGSADTALEVSVISYSDATTYNTYTQTIELTQENIEALQ